MKKIIFFCVIFMPLLVLGQDEISSVNHLSTETDLEKHLLWKISNDSQGHVGTTLIDDRNYYKSSINFALNESYSLSFKAKNKSLFKSIDNKYSDERLLESEPVLEFKWQFRKSN